jgi:NAD(P)-dependent dehydrogenase (short-subunit alcohol dehydrogenase family)
VLAVNLTVPVKMMREVLPLMKEKRDGVIVNVASTAATSGAVAGVAYTSSKHGLVCRVPFTYITAYSSTAAQGWMEWDGMEWNGMG